MRLLSSETNKILCQGHRSEEQRPIQEFNTKDWSTSFSGELRCIVTGTLRSEAIKDYLFLIMSSAWGEEKKYTPYSRLSTKTVEEYPLEYC